jgi:hypothetical protein
MKYEDTFITLFCKLNVVFVLLKKRKIILHTDKKVKVKHVPYLHVVSKLEILDNA